MAIGVDLGLEVFAHCMTTCRSESTHCKTSREGTAPTATRAIPLPSEAVTAAIKCVRKWPNCTVRSPDTRNSWLIRSRPGSSSEPISIVVEDLQVAEHDSSSDLGAFDCGCVMVAVCLELDYKVEKTGGHLIRVDPRNTTQECSRCHELVPKSLAMRTHQCPSCGLIIGPRLPMRA